MSFSPSPMAVHPNLKLLSHSSILLLHGCPRKYELYKLLPNPLRESNEHFDFGTIVGMGTEHYFTHNNMDRTYLHMLQKWPMVLADERAEKNKKTFFHALYALDKFRTVKNIVFPHYEVATFDGKPATELGFVIDFGNGWLYRGKLDILLYNRLTLELEVYEGKTTTNSNVLDAQFKHSAQALGYSLIVDTLRSKLQLTATSSYKVNYCVYKSKSYEWEVFPFNKSHVQRALWLKNILMDIQRIEYYAQEQYFPMYGEHCVSYNKVCQHFGTCELSNDNLIGPMEQVKLIVDKPDEYQFYFTIEDILAGQQEATAATPEMMEIL